MRVDLVGSFLTLACALTFALPVLPIVYYSVLPSLLKVILGGLVYLAAYLTLAPLFRAVKHTDVQTLAPILSQIRILKPVTDQIFAYETRLLNMLERNDDGRIASCENPYFEGEPLILTDVTWPTCTRR